MAAKRASALAARQFWIIARRQLLAVGFSEARIRSWLRSGRLHAIHPGVYAWGRPDCGVEGEYAAALLYAGPGAALGGLTALWWLSLLNRRPTCIHIDAPGRSRCRPGIRIRHPTRVERAWHRDIPVAALPAAILAAAPELGRNALRLVLARAEFQHLLDLGEVHAAIPGRRGAAAVRAALGSHLPQLARCESALEREFVLLCERSQLPLPEPNARIGRYRPDMLWRDARLIVELDGRDAHHTPAQLAADRRRQDDLERRGYVVIRFTWADVQRRPAELTAQLRSLLG